MLAHTIIISFYIYTMYSLVLWNKAVSNDQDSAYDGLFEFSLGPKVCIVVLAGLTYMLAGWAFLTTTVQLENNSNASERELGLVYCLLSIPVVFAVVLGTELLAKLIFGYGEFVDRRRRRESRTSQSRISQHKKTPKNNLFSRVAHSVYVYRKNTRPRGGKWFLFKMVFWEFMEVFLQSISLHSFAAERDQFYIIFVIGMINFNLVASPLLLYGSMNATSTYVRNLFNGAVLCTDTVTDSLFFGVNLYYLKTNDMHKNIAVASLMWPFFSMVLRIRTLGRLLHRKYMRDEVEHLRESCNRKRTLRCELTKRPLTRSQKIIVCVLAVLFSVSVVTACITAYAAIQVNKKCSLELGAELWNGATPKKTFPGGLFSPPQCNYHGIEEISAPGLGITQVSKTLGLCKNMRKLNLRGNAIVNLPIELLEMDGKLQKEHVKLEDNPVYRSLTLQNSTLQSKQIPSFIVKYMHDSLEYLNLANNNIETIQPEIDTFSRLKELVLDNNKIGEAGIPWNIVKKVGVLTTLSISGNPVSSRINWANQKGEGFDATRITEAISFLNKTLCPSLRALNVSGNALTATHFRDIRLKLQQLETLDMEDVSIMQERMETKGSYFNLKGTGIVSIEIKQDSGREMPRILLSQLQDSIQMIRIYDPLKSFEFSELCPLSSLAHFEYNLRGIDWKMSNATFCIPSCWDKLPSLGKLLLFVPLNLTCWRRNSKYLPRIFSTKIVLPQEYSENIELLPLMSPKTTMMHNFPFQPLPLSYSNENSTLFLTFLPSATTTYSIPSNWSGFDRIWVEGANVTGTVSHLKIEKVAVLRGTSVKGPLFKAGRDFQCTYLPYYTNFESMWNLTCDNITEQLTNASFLNHTYVPTTAATTGLRRCDGGPPYHHTLYCKTEEDLGRNDMLRTRYEQQGIELSAGGDTFHECYNSAFLREKKGKCSCLDAL